MKKCIFLIFTIIVFNKTFGQVVVSEIVTVDSTINKSTLFSNGLTWFAYNFKSANDVIQLKDFESGKIIGKGIFDVVTYGGLSTSRPILITLNVKDGKYKYEFVLDSKIDREFPITMNASCFNCGKTRAKAIYKDGVVQIVDISVGKNLYFYGNDNVSWLDKDNYKKWIAAVDAELPIMISKIENEIKNEEKKREEMDKLKLNAIIESLKLEMIKTNSDF